MKKKWRTVVNGENRKMKINKLMFLLLGIFLINFVSAGVYYNESDGDYGTYTIDTWIPTWLGGDGTSTAKLESNTDQCLINCGFHLSGFNEQPVSLMDDIKFLNRKGEDVGDSLLDISFQLGTYQEVEKYNPIYETTCENITDLNSTNGTSEVCNSELISNESYFETELVWLDYTGQQVDGYWELKANAKKDLKKSMDWIITFRGKELAEWAWWNNDFAYKRQINLTANAGDFSYLETITYDANMNNDFSDLRFINGAEDTEFNYTIESKTDGVSAIVRVFSQGETSFYMYYGNAAATTTSNAATTHFNPVSMYYLDETSGTTAFDAVGTNDGTNNGATTGVTGKIGTAYDFDGVNDYVDTNIATGYDRDFSVSLWFKGGTQSKIYPTMFNQNAGVTGTDRGMLIGFKAYTGQFGITEPGVVEIIYSPLEYDDDAWHHGVVTIGSGATATFTVYVDGSQVAQTTSSEATIGTFVNSLIGADGIGTVGNFLGKIDEVGIWSRALTSTEVSELYNYTAPTFTVGAEESQVGGLTIDYVTPPTYENYINTTNTYIPIEVNVTYTDTNFVNITYNVTSTEGYENITTYETEEYFVNFTNLTTGHYHYNVNVCAEDNNTLEIICAATSFRHVNHDIDAPEINITSPTGTFNYLYENYTLDLNWTVTDEGDNLDSCWYEYYQENSTIQEGVTYYNLDHERKGVTVSKISSTNYDLTNYNNFSYTETGCGGVSVSSSYTLYGNDTVLASCSGDFGTCCYDFNFYEGFKEEEVTCNDNTTTFNYIPEINNLTFYANDTFGNIGSESTSWDYTVLEIDRTFNNETIETESETFTIDLKSMEDLSGNFIYNGNSYPATESIIGDLVTRYTTTIDIPLVDEDTNITFYWNITNSISIDTYNSTILVKNLTYDFDETNELLNITIYDETTNELVNDTELEVLIRYYLGTGTRNETLFNSQIANGTFHLGTNLETNLNTINDFTYVAAGYQPRKYINNLILLNGTITDLTLYLLANAEGTTQLFNVYEATSLDSISGAKIEAYRVEGEDLIFVDAITTDDGGNGNLWLNPDEPHQIVTTKEGCTPKTISMYPTGVAIQDIALDCGGGISGPTYNDTEFFNQFNITVNFIPNIREVIFNSSDPTTHNKTFQSIYEDTGCVMTGAELRLINLANGVILDTDTSIECADTLSINYNITSFDKLRLYLLITKPGNNPTYTMIYEIVDIGELVYEGSSIARILDKITEIDDFGLTQKSKTFLAFVILFLILGYLSLEGIIKSEGYGLYIFILVYMFILSYVGWFTLNLPITMSNINIQNTLNQWILFFISALTIGGILLTQSEN